MSYLKARFSAKHTFSEIILSGPRQNRTRKNPAARWGEKKKRQSGRLIPDPLLSLMPSLLCIDGNIRVGQTWAKRDCFRDALWEVWHCIWNIEGSLCPRGTSKGTLRGQTQLFELLHWAMYKCKPVIQQMLSGDGDTEKWSDLSCTVQRFSGRVKMNQIIKKGINVWTDYKLAGRKKGNFLIFNISF